jgi:hypothetical protein
MNTSGAGGLYPNEACGLIVLYNTAPEHPQDREARSYLPMASLGGMHCPDS